MDWILLAITTAIFYGAYNFFIKISSNHINQIVGAVILQIVAAVVGGLVLIFLKISNNPLQISNKGISYAILAGVAVGLAEITSFYFFSKGISASIGIPIIIGGSVAFGTILGVVFLREELNLIHWLAIAMIVGGVVLLTTK